MDGSYRYETRRVGLGWGSMVGVDNGLLLWSWAEKVGRSRTIIGGSVVTHGGLEMINEWRSKWQMCRLAVARNYYRCQISTRSNINTIRVNRYPDECPSRCAHVQIYHLHHFNHPSPLPTAPSTSPPSGSDRPQPGIGTACLSARPGKQTLDQNRLHQDP